MIFFCKITIRASGQRAATGLPLRVRKAEKIHRAGPLAGARAGLGRRTICSWAIGQRPRAAAPADTIVIRRTIALPIADAGLDTLGPIGAAGNWAAALAALGINITIGIGAAFAGLGTRAAGLLT